MTDCIFCKIVSGDIPCYKVYEDDSVLSFLDIGPISDGHTLVIPKEHVTSVASAKSETIAAVGAVLPKIAAAVQAAVNAEAYNVLCNNGKAAGQVVEHLHFHIIPRSEGDGKLKGWPSFEYEKGKAEKILENILDKIK